MNKQIEEVLNKMFINLLYVIIIFIVCYYEIEKHNNKNILKNTLKNTLKNEIQEIEQIQEMHQIQQNKDEFESEVIECLNNTHDTLQAIVNEVIENKKLRQENQQLKLELRKFHNKISSRLDEIEENIAVILDNIINIDD